MATQGRQTKIKTTPNLLIGWGWRPVNNVLWWLYCHLCETDPAAGLFSLLRHLTIRKSLRPDKNQQFVAPLGFLANLHGCALVFFYTEENLLVGVWWALVYTFA